MHAHNIGLTLLCVEYNISVRGHTWKGTTKHILILKLSGVMCLQQAVRNAYYTVSSKLRL